MTTLEAKREWMRLDRLSNPEKYRLRARQKYEKNKEAIKRKAREYYQHNRTTVRNAQAIYSKANRSKLNQYRRLKETTDINFKLASIFRSRLRRHLSKCKYSISVSPLKTLGCTLPEFKTYLETKFTPGMTWENYGRNGWHIDHIQPLSSFNLVTTEEQQIALHYTNMQPLWAIDNLRKGTKCLP